MAELTQEQKDLQKKLLAEFMDSRYYPTPVMFAARAEILRLQERVAELEGKSTKKGRGEPTP